MRHYEWKRIGMTGAHVDEVDIKAVDVRQKLRQGVQSCLYTAPIVAILPILNERLQFGDLYALRSVVDRFNVRPSCLRQTALEVVNG
ncbi:hypothetical protein BLJAPNOD_05099 [Ensifer sp. M14]|nr:hypothetical protein BLJAPNOD_05099 [Ensifer sp. M14]